MKNNTCNPRDYVLYRKQGFTKLKIGSKNTKKVQMYAHVQVK